MTKIIIAGIGGVGGYFGGLLAKKFHDNPTVEIDFLARGENLKAIQINGLTIVRGTEQWLVKPKIATDDPATLGKADVIMLCTKNYDLEATVLQLKPCISDKTIIIPLLNGVNSREVIQKYYPNNLVTEGCVYIISRLTAPGKVENTGSTENLFFGLDQTEDERLVQLESLFKQADIHAKLSNDILKIIWEKFIFISATATSTSFYNQGMGAILKDSEKKDNLLQLVKEGVQLAKAKQIPVSANIEEITLNKLQAMPPLATSSMHADFANRKQHTELESLTGYMVHESEKLGLPVPTFKKMYESLK
ncbi:ketopantoate reductase family protein [Pedobacter sp.]|uniref:ketopantoate reductase family protein n=1 Tax=Pedobacter sp. TaxID=1411316 RepID=UPI00396C31B6